MSEITLQTLPQLPIARRRTEHVERKGLGHPDTMCDRMMEAASVALSRAYLTACGRVLHHNLDKGLLVAGQSRPALGGGEVLAPMRLIFGDRATAEVNGQTIPVGEIVVDAAQAWVRSHLPRIDPAIHLTYQNEIQPGSPELVDIFAREVLAANDTSAAVGYAPLTETEQLVLATESFLNSAAFKARYPMIGGDIKVMAFRRDRELSLTVAAAFVDRHVASERDYFEHKESVCGELLEHLRPQLRTLDSLNIALNTLDSPARGMGGMYLTVLGTSAEGADGGEVGRGNRVNGLISLHRPMSIEAAAGKNPVSHVGKIYSLLAHQLAGRISAQVSGVDEVTVWLASQIGRPLADPWSVAVEITPLAGAEGTEFENSVRLLVESELAGLPAFVERLIRGELPVC
jgi:S-adenosylmethionine synthetase